MKRIIVTLALVCLVEEEAAEKLSIAELEAANKDERYYRLRNGMFKVQEAGGTDASLNGENKIRVNIRNFAEFKDTITLTFYGIKIQGENE